MGNSIHKLTKKQVSAISEPGRYNDGGGLYLFVRIGGTKSWTYRFRQDGRLREMSLRPVSAAKDLLDARQKAAKAIESNYNQARTLFRIKGPSKEKKKS